MFASSQLKAAALVLVFAASAAAQDSTATTTSSPLDRMLAATTGRGSLTFSVIQGRPQGAFGDNIGRGYGAGGAYLFRLDRAGIWSVRTDVGIVRYGDESRQTPLSETVGGRVLVDVTTANYIVPVTIGTQLAWPRGAFRPYVNAGVGGQAFFTESTVGGVAQAGAIAGTTNHSSLAAAWALGGGASMPLVIGRTPVALDVGVQYLRGGNTQYLGLGSITDLPGARIAITPLESTTHMMVVRIGARIGR